MKLFLIALFPLIATAQTFTGASLDPKTCKASEEICAHLKTLAETSVPGVTLKSVNFKESSAVISIESTNYTDGAKYIMAIRQKVNKDIKILSSKPSTEGGVRKELLEFEVKR